MLLVTTTLSIKVKEIKIKLYQLKMDNESYDG